MIDDTDALLNDLLRRWHGWAVSAPIDIGYPTECPTCRLYRTSRQYDSDNGALDQDADSRVMEAVDHCIARVQQPHRTALYISARNLWTGLAVWSSARLPQDAVERARMVCEARALLLVELRASGIG